MIVDVAARDAWRAWAIDVASRAEAVATAARTGLLLL